ncbi:hypothetical protein GCM10007147_27950 [Nocardiopsis kunsanensis]|uniref:LPXTG cell wall anchor domain-containing protein n=1 Tax=Nocardiopsis kunsanensis TaxID=141693 RepID=A0A919CJF1_9ACTN|nr:hypothetical protein GCM10007147_27950 [Nocardiopsis kunsanensis]
MSVSRALLTAPAVLLGSAVALAPAPATADAGEDFPASADSTLVRLEAPGEDLRGFWGHVHAESELGEDRAAAEFATDPTGITPYLEVAGPQRSEVGTSAEGTGHAEAHTAAAGVELVLPGEEERPLVSVDGLRTSVACDFHGNLSWDHALGGEGFSEQVLTVMGTPIAADEPEVTEVVEGPGGKAAEITVTTDRPDSESGRSGSAGTTVTAVQDGEELFELTLGEVAVECGTPEDTVDGESGTDGEEAPASDGTDERSEPLPETAEEERTAPEPGSGAAPGTETPTEETPAEEAPAESGRDDSDRTAEEDAAAGTEHGDSGQGLPVTGAAVAGLAAVGTLALAGGGLALHLGRKRRSAAPDDD